MRLEDIHDVAVIGSGTMGNGIAQVFATTGYNVTMIDLDQAFLEKGMAKISKSLDRMVKKEKITEEDKATALGRIKMSTDLQDCASTQLVVEAITEQLEPKLVLWSQIAEICGEETIFASNTSSLPITQIAAATKRPKQFIGMHFMNPVPMSRLIELIRGLDTTDTTFQVIRDLSKKLGKTPEEANDYPGFIANRILMPMINEAIQAHMEGVGTVEAIDEVMKLGMAHPMGPLTLADFIGLDVCMAILEVMHREFGNPKYSPSPLLRKMVQAGYLGRKTGRGFYTYE
jgi:3-hydroxybutyryl-CoA dehydrogenase